MDAAALALRPAVTRCLADHDLEGAMPHGAPADEYAPEARDFAELLGAGQPVTGEVVSRGGGSGSATAVRRPGGLPR